MNLQMILEQLAMQMGWACRVQYDGSTHVEVPYPGGRTQVVHISQGYDAESEPMVYLWSIACDWQSARDVWAILRYGMQLSYGAVALQDANVVIKHSMRLSQADQVSLHKAIYHVGLAADQLEAQAYGYVDRL